MLTIQKSNGEKRKPPVATGRSDFFYIEVKSKEEFKTFRTQEVSGKNGIERVVGQREDGTWETVKWLVSKKMAHVENGKLVADDKDARELFDKLNHVPKHIEGDRFEAKG